MNILNSLKESINKVGVKEVARRSGLSPSTVSRVHSGVISPSFEVVEKIVSAIGFSIWMQPEARTLKAPRLEPAKDILIRLRKELKQYGVRHVVIFGSVSRKKDGNNSDIDIYLEFLKKPSASELLKAEGRVLESFGETRVDIVSRLDSVKGQKLKTEIEKDGVYVF